MPPTLSIMAPEPLLVGSTATFTAQLRDDQPVADVQVQWGRGPTCPATQAAANMGSAGSGATYQFPVDDEAPLCVWASARDPHGAQAYASVMVTPKVPQPNAVITVVAPTTIAAGKYRLMSRFRLSAATSQVGKSLQGSEYRWQITRPDGGAARVEDCSEPGSAPFTQACFVAEVPGDYQVALTVGNAASSHRVTQTLTIDIDQPPCIRRTDPMLMRLPLLAGESRTFTINEVDDDVDPWTLGASPPDSSRFTWSLGPQPGQLGRTTIQGHQFSVRREDLFNYNQDTLYLRVEYRDSRNAPACAPQLDRCETPPGSGCYQWITWVIEFR